MADIEPVHRKSCVSLAGRTSLTQAIDIMSATDAAISNDSGLTHIAAALDKPVVALYGSTSSDFTPPSADRVRLLATDRMQALFQARLPLRASMMFDRARARQSRYGHS